MTLLNNLLRYTIYSFISLFSIVVQCSLQEKLGKASNSADSEEIKFIKEKLHLIKWILKHSKIAGADYTHHNDVSNVIVPL